MKRQKRTVGAFVKIDLENGFYSIARILENANYAFYDILLPKDEKDYDLNDISKKPILFILAVYDHAITKGRWSKKGKLPLEENLQILPNKFIQDEFNLAKFELYNSDTGEISPASRIECLGLECAAVWEPEHVESRIQDYYNGEPNVWVEQLKIK